MQEVVSNDTMSSTTARGNTENNTGGDGLNGVVVACGMVKNFGARYVCSF